MSREPLDSEVVCVHIAYLCSQAHIRQIFVGFSTLLGRVPVLLSFVQCLLPPYLPCFWDIVPLVCVYSLSLQRQ